MFHLGKSRLGVSTGKGVDVVLGCRSATNGRGAEIHRTGNPLVSLGLSWVLYIQVAGVVAGAQMK